MLLRNSSLRNGCRALLVSASILGLAAHASAEPFILFSSSGASQLPAPGETVTQTGGVTQLKLDDGTVISIVGKASYTLDNGGVFELLSGDITVVTPAGAGASVRLPGGVLASLMPGASAGFSAENGDIDGHAITGTMRIGMGGVGRNFVSGDKLKISNGRIHQTLAVGPQATPQGPSGAAQNGMPVVLGDALAAIGASGDILFAADRIDAYLANPAVGTLPTGDVELLSGYLARLASLTGGQFFNDVEALQTFLDYLTAGGLPGNYNPNPTPNPTPTPTLLRKLFLEESSF